MERGEGRRKAERKEGGEREEGKRREGDIEEWRESNMSINPHLICSN